MLKVAGKEKKKLDSEQKRKAAQEQKARKEEEKARKAKEKEEEKAIKAEEKTKKTLREDRVNEREKPRELKTLTQSHATCNPALLTIKTRKHAVQFAMPCMMTPLLSGYAVTSVTFGTIWNALMCLKIASQTLLL